MRRDLAEPFDAAVLQRGGWVDVLGDSVGDDGLPLLLEQRDHPLLLRNQPINLRRLAIEEVDYILHFIERWNGYADAANGVRVEI